MFAIYCPSLRNSFVNWDDGAHLLDNQSLRSLDSEHISEIFHQKVNNIYIPLTTLSFALEYKFFGYNPFIYHLDNVLLHLVVVVMVFFLARGWGLSAIGAGIGAFIFGIHPMHVESVAWVTERKDVLYAVFYVLSLWFYTQYLRKLERQWYFLSLATGIFSILAKPMALSLPLILLLCDWFKGRKFEKKIWIEKIPFFVILAGLAWLTFSEEHSRMAGNNILEGILMFLWTGTFYLKQFIFPGILLPIYPVPKPITILQMDYALSLAVFLLLLGVVFRYRRQKWVIFAFGFYLFSIFFLFRFDPTIGVHIVADRFMYLPSLGFCLLIGLGGQWLAEQLNAKSRKVEKGIILAGLLVIAGCVSLRTLWQTKIWMNSVFLWNYQLLFTPQEPIALNNLANAYRDQPQYKKIEEKYRTILKLKEEGVPASSINNSAFVINKMNFIIGLYEQSIKSDSGYVDAYYNLGKFYQDMNQNDKALNLYQKAVEINPYYKDAYFNQGHLFAQAQQPQKALDAYAAVLQTNRKDSDNYINVIKGVSEAIQADPDHADIYKKAREDYLIDFRNLVNSRKESEVLYFNLGYVYQNIHDYQAAKAAYELALDVNPNFMNALFNLADVYDQIGDSQQAVNLYEKVLNLQKNNTQAYINLGIIYGRLKNYDKAVECYTSAIRVNPKEANAYFNLGFVYEITGKIQLALENYENAIKTNPKHAEAYYNLGNVYASIKDNAKALDAYRKTIALNPNHLNALVNLSIVSFQEKDYASAIKYGDEARLLGYDAPKEYLRELDKYRAQEPNSAAQIQKK